MTVCIAAICTLPNGTLGVVGVSDRMLTAGDVEFEPPQLKVYSPVAAGAPRSAILVAGDTAAQIRICDATRDKLARCQALDIEVQTIADLYASEYINYRQRESETLILAPLGLTLDSFVARQKTMAPDVVQRLEDELQHYRFDPQAIICGVDAKGAHIFRVSSPGVVTCEDAVGFAAIGIGAWHAESQFMFASYVRQWSLSHALLLTYSAKRRAEVAPGVGRWTDLIFIEPGGAGVIPISDAIRTKLNDLYDEITEKEAKAAATARAEVDGFINTLLNPPPTPPPPSGAGEQATSGPLTG